MLPCEKRQTLVKNGDTTYRCLHKDCDAYKLPVIEEVCAHCPLRVSKVVPVPTERPKLYNIPESFDITSADTPDGQVPDFPSLSMQLFNYKQALLKWQAAGRPTRTDEQVEQLLETYCKKCDWYDNGRCRGCGCRVTEGGLAVLNKLRMATEVCPKELWK